MRTWVRVGFLLAFAMGCDDPPEPPGLANTWVRCVCTDCAGPAGDPIPLEPVGRCSDDLCGDSAALEARCATVCASNGLTGCASTAPEAEGPCFLLDIDGRILQPILAGDGPHRALAVSETGRRVFMTRESSEGPALTVIDTNQLTRDGTTTHGLTPELAGADVPRSIALDDVRGHAWLEAINPDPSMSRLLRYDAGSGTFTSVSIPNLASGRALIVPSSDELITYRERPDGAGFVGEIVRIDLSASTPSPTFVSVPGGMPSFRGGPLLAAEAGLIFFPADKRVPSDTFCDFTRCEIWVWNIGSVGFVDAARLTVSTPLVTHAGVMVATVANAMSSGAMIPGELLIVVTDNQVYIWRTAEVFAGRTTPTTSWSHEMGVGATVSAVAYIAPTEQIVLGNKSGSLRLFEIDGGPGPEGIPLPDLPGFATGMQVRDIHASPNGAVYVSMGGFLPGATSRAGLIAALDLGGSVSGDGRLDFVQPVAALGLGGPTIVVDEGRGVVYTNAVVDSNDSTDPGAATYRTPVLRALGETSFAPSGCP